jgi:hypothetical protein
MVAHHVLHLQVFQRNQVAVLYQDETQFVREVLPLVDNMLMPALNLQQRLLAVLAAFLLALKAALQQAEFRLCLPVERRIFHPLAIAGGEQVFHIHINADAASGFG